MSITNVIRAWKDADYRSTLSQEELAKLPANPAGTSELSDKELADVSGGGTCGTGCHCSPPPPPPPTRFAAVFAA